MGRCQESLTLLRAGHWLATGLGHMEWAQSIHWIHCCLPAVLRFGRHHQPEASSVFVCVCMCFGSQRNSGKITDFPNDLLFAGPVPRIPPKDMNLLLLPLL